MTDHLPKLKEINIQKSVVVLVPERKIENPQEDHVPEGVGPNPPQAAVAQLTDQGNQEAHQTDTHQKEGVVHVQGDIIQKITEGLIQTGTTHEILHPGVHINQ